jgi:antigen flippase
MQTSSYGQILRSSSVMGGAQAINYLIGMVRIKLVALLLGPSGIGLVGLYVSISGLVSTFAQLGIDQSGVREVAEAESSRDRIRLAHVVKTLRVACWLTASLGWLMTIGLAWPLSQWTFGSSERMWSIAVLGCTVFLGCISSGQSALLQGLRRVGDLAKVQVLSAVLTTVVAIGLYMSFGEDAVVPVIISTALITLGFTSYFTRKIQIESVSQTWVETLTNSKRLISLGAAFMYSALLAAVVGLAIRTLTVRDLGLEASGFYQAAWGLSGMFAGFILGAMGTDFYPRLSAVAKDDNEVNRLVNEQIEVGVLLALPGLLFTLAFGPVVIHLFYSSKFISAATLLPWFLLGVFGQVISWPLGMIQMAKGAQGWIYVSRTFGNLMWLLLAYLLIKNNGLVGICWSFAIYVWIQNGVVYLIARKLSGFRFSSVATRIVGGSSCLVLIAFLVQSLSLGNLGSGLISIISLVAGIFSVRGIALRLGSESRFSQLIFKLPIMKWLCN